MASGFRAVINQVTKLREENSAAREAIATTIVEQFSGLREGIEKLNATLERFMTKVSLHSWPFFNFYRSLISFTIPCMQKRHIIR
jgi:hypothetical protein